MTKKSIEKPLLIICGLALLVELLDVWWSGILLVMIFCSLSFFYMLFSVLPDNEKVNTKNLKNLVSKGYRTKSLINLFGGICLAYLAIGILAKVQIWWWANNALQVCIVFGIILLIAALIKKNSWLSSRLVFFLGVATILYFISNETIIEFKYRNNPEYKKEIYESLEQELK